MTNHELSTQLFLQLTVILCCVKLVGRAAKLIGQPQVVGEMIAGVLLGPSLFGNLFPELRDSLFPKQSIPVIYCLSQLGLTLYMFMVGLEFDYALLRSKLSTAVGVSLAGILAPFILGGSLGYYYSSNTTLFPEHVGALEAALFCGAALSITAFPMLARIIHERGISGTSLGTLTLSAGAVNDALAWCILALVLASVLDDPTVALYAIGGGVAFCLLVAFVFGPLAKKIIKQIEDSESLTRSRKESFVFSWILLFLCASAWFTDSVGIYAVFGSFILGMAVPRTESVQRIEQVLEPLTTYLLLPLFFVYSGLNTQLFLVLNLELLLVTLGFLLAACLGKGIACGAVAYLLGESKRDSFAIGALMNARGLMELILLNIALERNLITPATFTSLVIVAIVTTLLATPLFNLSQRGVVKSDALVGGDGGSVIQLREVNG